MIALACERQGKLIIHFLHSPPAALYKFNFRNSWTLIEFWSLQGIYHRLGDVFMRLKKWSEAERFHRAALEAEPNHIGAHISYGTMLARNVSIVSWCLVWWIVLISKHSLLAPLETLEQSIIGSWTIFQTSNSLSSSRFQRTSSLW